LIQEAYPPTEKEKEQWNLKKVDGIWWAYGRFPEAEALYYMPRGHALTLLVEYHHRRLHHASIGTILSLLRTQYWFAQGRRVVRGVAGKCIACKRHLV
jgi:hypothetical protein